MNPQSKTMSSSTTTTRDDLELTYILENSTKVSDSYKTFQKTLLSLSGVSCWEPSP